MRKYLVKHVGEICLDQQTFENHASEDAVLHIEI